MKDERMEVLKLLGQGVIDAEQAERLLLALQGVEKSGFSSAMGETLNKTTSVLQNIAEKVSEKAAVVLDEAKNCAEKLEPKIKKAAEKMSEKTEEFREDAKTYAENLKRKREQAAEEKENEEKDTDIFAEATEVTQAEDDINEEEDVELKKQMENLSMYMEKLQGQMGVIDEAEAFLKAFEEEYDEDEDEEETKEKEEKEEKPAE